MYPLAPTLRAWMTLLSASKVVRIMTFTSGCSATMFRVASMPSMFGIRRSISTMSGLMLETFWTASKPSAASPTTFTRSSPSSRRARPERKSVWSSTMSTRGTVAVVFISSLACPLGLTPPRIETAAFPGISIRCRSMTLKALGFH